MSEKTIWLGELPWRPIKNLTEEEKDHLKWIREIGGKGYIRDYCIKMVHVCPSCNQAKGWRRFTECLGCGHKLPTSEHYFKLERRERWEHVDKAERWEEPPQRKYI